MAHIVVIATYQKDGVIGSRPDHDRAHKDDRLHVHGQAELGEPGQRALRSDHRRSDGGQRHQHGHQVPIDEDQDDQHADRGADLDDPHIFLAELRQVGDRGDRTAEVDGQAGSRDCLLDDRGDAFERRLCLRRRGIARERDGQVPSLVVLAGQQLLHFGDGEKILNRYFVLRVRPQVFDQFSVDGLVGGSQPVLVGQEDQKEGGGLNFFLESRAHLLLQDHRWGPGRQGSLLALCGLRLQRWEQQRQRGRHRDPAPNDDQRPSHHEVADTVEQSPGFGLVMPCHPITVQAWQSVAWGNDDNRINRDVAVTLAAFDHCGRQIRRSGAFRGIGWRARSRRWRAGCGVRTDSSLDSNLHGRAGLRSRSGKVGISVLVHLAVVRHSPRGS